MNLKSFLLLALTLARGAAASQADLIKRCRNWQTWQSFNVYATCTDINGNDQAATIAIDQCVNYLSDSAQSGLDCLDTGAYPYTRMPGFYSLASSCTACGIYEPGSDHGLVCRCYTGDNDYHWCNPLPLDAIFKVNDDGTLACVNPATH